jgi:ribosome-associated protein
MEFNLEDHEYIELNRLLKLLGLVESGGQANMFITEGQVEVNGEAEYRKRKKLRSGDEIHFMNSDILIID